MIGDTRVGCLHSIKFRKPCLPQKVYDVGADRGGLGPGASSPLTDSGITAMKLGLLQVAACLNCQSPLEIRVEREEDEEILEGWLICPSCQARFPVRRGIPRFLPSELPSDKKATAAAFGYEWTHYAELSEQDREEFLDWIKPLDRDSFTDRVILDAGCGKGRHASLAVQFGARNIVGVDLSEAVAAAYQNTRHLPNVHILQADLYCLPFRDPFDLAYSIGVLHRAEVAEWFAAAQLEQVEITQRNNNSWRGTGVRSRATV